MFLLSLKNINAREFFLRYYIPFVEIKDFNVLIDNKPFFDQPVKSKLEMFEKLIEISRNDDHAIGNLLEYLHHQIYYELVGIDLSRQKNTGIPQ